MRQLGVYPTSASPQVSSPTKRYVLLDGFRGLAAIYVVLSHVGGETYHGLQWGNIRVDFFFVLSGFVLQRRIPQADDQRWASARSFIRSRFFRLWPMLLTVLFARLLIWGIWILKNPDSPVTDFRIIDFPTSFIAAVLLLQVLVPSALEWADPLWSLSAEWLTNLGVAVGGAILGKIVWPVCFVVGYIFLFLGSLSDASVNTGFAAMGRALIGFSLGAMVRIITDAYVRKFWWPRFLLAAGLTYGIFAYQIFLHRTALPIAAIVMAFLVAEVITLDQTKIPHWILRTSSYIGTVSFGVYAWHNNFITLITSDLLPIVPMKYGEQTIPQIIVTTLVVVLMSIVATHLTTRYIEKPAQKRWSKKRIPVAAGT